MFQAHPSLLGTGGAPEASWIHVLEVSEHPSVVQRLPSLQSVWPTLQRTLPPLGPG